jgi:hypothetical protein
MRQLMLVAGPQPLQIGVDPVRDRGSLVHQLVSYSVRTRRAGGDAGDRYCVKPAGLPWPGWLSRSREVINGSTSTTFRSCSIR